MVKKDFLDKLFLLNNKLMELDSSLDLYIAGGMGIAFNVDDVRATDDADVFKNKMPKSIIEILDKFDINVEISKVVKDESYKLHSYLAKESESFSNIDLHICNNTYLFVLKCLAQISPNRSDEKKEVDLEDVKSLYKTVNFNEAFKIIEELQPKSINNEHKKYLIEEVKK